MDFITISRFKAQALQILDRVTRTHEGIVVPANKPITGGAVSGEKKLPAGIGHPAV